MTQETFQLSGNAAAIYEQQKVPAMFGPLAEVTLKVVALHENDDVLDVACGTGIVARKVRGLIGSAGRVVGTDLNEGMIEAARNLTDAEARSCEWQTADVTALPFEDGAFSIAFCQQGLQFFPDKEAALREIWRVLRADGRIVLAVWSEASKFFMAMSKALRDHVSEEIAERTLAPFAYDANLLRPLLSEIGFVDVSSEILAVDRVLSATEASVRNEILGNPVGPFVMEKGEKVMQKVVGDILEATTEFRQGDHLVIPQCSYLFQARVG